MVRYELANPERASIDLDRALDGRVPGYTASVSELANGLHLVTFSAGAVYPTNETATVPEYARDLVSLGQELVDVLPGDPSVRAWSLMGFTRLEDDRIGGISGPLNSFVAITLVGPEPSEIAKNLEAAGWTLGPGRQWPFDVYARRPGADDLGLQILTTFSGLTGKHQHTISLIRQEPLAI